MTISCTYAPLPEVSDVGRLTREAMDAAVDAGKFILFHDGEKVKVARGVNSLQTTTQDGPAHLLVHLPPPFRVLPQQVVEVRRQPLQVTPVQPYRLHHLSPFRRISYSFFAGSKVWATCTT